MCVDHPVTRDGVVVDWSQEKCFSSDSLSSTLYKEPFLLTNDNLPHLLLCIANHVNSKGRVFFAAKARIKTKAFPCLYQLTNVLFGIHLRVKLLKLTEMLLRA